MKKIFIIFISIVLSCIFFLQTSASNVSEKNQLFKKLALSNTQMEKDYSKKYSSNLDLYFNKIRYYKKRNDLLILEKKIEILVNQYNKKSYLNLNDKKTLNLLKNIYYRSKILSKYYLK